jgi:CheY-like chemotaxis protein
MIDDNPLEHLIMETMLNNYKIFPDMDHSMAGDVTIAYLESNYTHTEKLPDVIFLDLNMPDFSGWDFVKSFAKLYPQLKKTIDIYIVSSSIDPKDLLRSEKYPFVKAYFTKPVNKDTLVNLYSFYRQ